MTVEAVAGLAMPLFGAAGVRWVVHSHVDEQQRWWLRLTDGVKWYQTQVTPAIIAEQAKNVRISVDRVHQHFAGKLGEGLFSAKTPGAHGDCTLFNQDGYSFVLAELHAERAHEVNREFVFAVASACAKRNGNIGSASKDGEDLLLGQIKALTVRLEPAFWLLLLTLAQDELSALKSQQAHGVSLSQNIAVAPALDFVVSPAKRPPSGRPVHAVKRKVGASLVNPWTKDVHQSHRPEFEDDDDAAGA